MNDDYANTEHDRRIANLVRVGTVAELDEANAKVKIDLGDLISEWVPWVTGRAGPDRTWHAPEVGEQVVLLSPSGEVSQGVALPSVYQTAHGAPATSKDKARTEFSDGAFIQYDRAGHLYDLDVPAAGKVTIHVGASTLVLQDNNITATIGDTVLKLEANKTTLTTELLQVTAPQSNFSGNVTIGGLLTYQGGLIGSGGSGASLTGALNVVGNVSNTGTLQNNGKNVGSTHTHSGVTPGGGSTSVPN